MSSSVENNFRVFPYTNTYYIADVNATGFFSRDYYFRLSRANFDKNFTLMDEFTGADNDPINTSIWFEFSANSTGEVDIASNDANFFSIGSGGDSVEAIISDVNVEFGIGSVFNFEWISNNRPTVVGGSALMSAGFMPDNNANPNSSSPRFSIDRGNNGVLNISHGTATANQLDGGTGPKKFRVRLERTSTTIYNVQFFIDDTNLMAEFDDTVAHNLWKGTVWLRGGNAGGNTAAATVAEASLFNDNSFIIQPYLASTSNSRQVTVEVARVLDISEKLPNTRILSEAFIEGAGLQEVETVVTDSQGQAVMSFIIGTRYTLTLFDSLDNQLTQIEVVISPTQSGLFINLEEEELFPDYLQQFVAVGFGGSPAGGSVDVNTTTITFTFTFGTNSTITDINIIVFNDDLNRFSIDGNIGATSPFTNQIELNGIPLNPLLPIRIQVNVIADNNSFWFTTQYNVPVEFGGVPFITGVARGRFKSDLGCTSGEAGQNDLCLPSAILAFIITAMITASVAFQTRILNLDSASILFMIILGLFAYFYWIPLFLYGILAVMAVANIFAGRR